MRNIQVMSHNAIYRIVTGSPNGQLKVWSYNSGECLKTLDKGECSTCIYRMIRLCVYTVFVLVRARVGAVYRKYTRTLFILPRA